MQRLLKLLDKTQNQAENLTKIQENHFDEMNLATEVQYRQILKFL